MMGYDSGGASQDSHDEDDDGEYDEAGSGNRFLGFMFGNVDNSGDLDVDYLDEDAKEHLAALADKLGPSLADIDLSVKSPKTSAEAAEEDYDEKAEDAVDYEDIEEQYEGPEVQAATEEDNILREKEYLSAQVHVAYLHDKGSVFDDDNYDEEEAAEEIEVAEKSLDEEEAAEEIEVAEKSLDEASALEGEQSACTEKLHEGDIPSSQEEYHVSQPCESPALYFEEMQESDESEEELRDEKISTPLPVLCVENDMVILRFSEIFGIHEFPQRKFKRDSEPVIYKERVKTLGASDVEEDEEAYLRGFSQGLVTEHPTYYDVSGVMDSRKFNKNSSNPGDDWSPVVSDELRDDDFCGGPLKESPIELSSSWKLPRSPNFYPLDQQDWENFIVWDTSPGSPDELTKQSAEDIGTGVNHSNANGIVESKEAEEPVDPDASATILHPQLLRLESRLPVNSHVVGSEEISEMPVRDYAAKQFGKLSSESNHLLEDSWEHEIIWEPKKYARRPKLILDLQDRKMLFEILNEKETSNFWVHAEAMIITRASNSDIRDSVELSNHGVQSDWQFDIANDMFYSNRKRTQQLNTNSEKRTAYGVEVFHSAPAIKLDTMKLKLSNKDIANFHRPKALWYPHDNEVAVKEQEKLPTLGPMKIIIKSLGGKGSRLHVDAEETVASIKGKGSKKLDFKLSEPVKLFYRGNALEDNKSLAMQNVQPNSLLHVVRTKVHLLPRAQKIPSENKSLRPPGAFKKKSDLSVKDGHVFLMEYCEERPLLLSNVGMGARLCTYYQKTNPSDQNGSMLRAENKILGSLIPLDSSDKSPFLGDIKAGSTQSSLETNMYRSPVFPHKVSGTDYLLVRSAKGKLSIRRIDKINVVGQQEPLLEVMSTGTKDLQSYLLKRVLVYMFRQFRELKKRGLPPCVRADELALQFPNLSEPFLRNRLKKHASAELKRGSHGQWVWKMRPNFHIPSEEALRKLVPPEKVCAYESMQAGLYRLKHLGITRLVHPTGISSALSQLPNEAIALAAASHIERELQITPWNLSSNFVACTNQVRENLERLEISGVGDPSGRGLGFSYVRAAPKATMGNALTKKKAAAGRGGSTVTGTDADLRRLSMEAAREVLLKFNVPEEVIAKQTRWHRIAMIRELSSEQAASGVQVDPSTISKYARGQRMSFVQIQQQTREKCQEIWDRQVQSLTNIDGDEVASDSESNSDLDSFAGDLENLLDAEEGEGDEVNAHKNDRPDGVKGLKMRRHSSLAEAEEKVEDEAAEAAELCRMLMDDDDTGLMRKEKVLPVRKEIGPTLRSQAAFGHDKVEPVKKPKKIVKPVTTALYNDVSQEDILSDQTEMEALIARDHFPLKVKAKKLKILGDGLMTTSIFTEKKSARESFVCGACGQLGHMRTNKNCPRYGEDPDAQADAIDRDKLPGKLSSIDPVSQFQQKPVMKKIIPKGPTRIAVVEATEDPYSKPNTKVQKIVISSKMKPAADGQHEPYKPSIVIRPPIDSDKVSVETPRTSIVFRSMGDTERAQGEVNKPSILIKPPADSEREQPQKKIIIRRPKEVIDLDLGSQDGGVDYDFRKTKKIVELSDLGSYRKQDIYSAETSSKKKSRGDKRWWEEEEKRRTMERLREERTNRYYMEEMRQLEERERIAEIERYEVSLRKEREEEERQKAKKKKKKMKKFDPGDDYLEDYRGRRNDTWTMERDRPVRRRPIESVSLSAEYAAPAKRRRGGEVGLSNILEGIVETLRSRQEVSYLFLKPVTKKEAPDYLDIIDKPMDLSTIREKLRRMEYKNREDFRHDVWQITFNAHKYNDGRNPGIPPLADQLLELCDYLLNENDESLTEAEEGIEY